MATITGLTADRMIAIEGSSVVSGTVSGDNLLLTKHNGQQITAGNVRGPKGDKGDQGPIGPVQSVNDEVGAVYAPRVFPDLPTLLTWTTAPVGLRALLADINAEFWMSPSGWRPVPGQVLQITATEVNAQSTMNGSTDLVFNDAVQFPFPTLSRISFTSLMIAPDRQSSVGAIIFSNNFGHPSANGSGQHYDITNGTSTYGHPNLDQYNLMSSIKGQQLLGANMSMIWYLRLYGVAGGPTNFKYNYTHTLERITLPY